MKSQALRQENSKAMVTASDTCDLVLHPGEYAVAAAGSRICTLLGSCVSITLWHPKLRIGAMSHFLLAQRGSPNKGLLDARYGEESLELMIADLARAHVFPAQCQAKIFGGGNMFPGQDLPGAMHVGRRNGEAARTLLQQHGIRVVSESLFGHGPRRIVFDVASGHVWVRFVDPNAGPAPQTGAHT